ncbi:serine hydrolase domain-containing protein [Aquabacterium sp.]|uniref:serine hydrolase domain-containing protein n=1 Tax=Aquabacterium sp. TaxID=1872578 RepID=UPI0040383D75
MNVSTRQRINRSALTLASFAAGFAATFLPLTAMAAATLQVVQGSGEFQTLDTAVTVTAPTAFTMQWTTDQVGAAGGTWKVTDANSQVLASGEATPAPAVGHFLRFSIPQNAFLPASTATTKQYKLSIQPHNGVMQAMGTASPNVVVTQVPATSTPPIVFGPSANFPKVDIINYEEKIGVVPLTQLHYAGADITLRVTNKSKAVTDPAWLAVKDTNLLMRQNTSGVSIPSLQPGASTTVSVHLDAVLPPPTSQLPEDQQYSQWNAQYRNVCGPQLSSVLDWRGPQAQTPIGSHLESLLVKEGWSDYAKVPPSTPICQGTQCVRVCDIEKNIHAQLDGKVTGYSFFVGQYPKFTGHGDARTSADAPETAFKSNTKITVASVSKLVTTIAAVRLIDQKAASMPLGLDTPIGAYLPADWAPQSNYIKNITFAQLLGQRSGIKDYGNVSMDYAQLKKFFTQSTNAMANTSCQGSGVINPANPVNVNNQSWCYSNYNFAIMRVLLPKVAGFAEDANQATRPQTLANQYTALVQQNVFNLVGQNGVTCKPPVASTNYAFAYKGPASNAQGKDWGDVSLICGAAGWYLSVEDMAKVMLSLNAKDGKILAASGGKDLFETMRKRGLGWDVDNNGELEKNGGWGANCDGNNVCDNITTSVAMFGPVTGPRVLGVLFINSNITGGGGAQGVLEKAYNQSLYIKP